MPSNFRGKRSRSPAESGRVFFDPHSLPELDELAAATSVEFGSGREEAGVNGSDRGSAEDVE